MQPEQSSDAAFGRMLQDLLSAVRHPPSSATPPSPPSPQSLMSPPNSPVPSRHNLDDLIAAAFSSIQNPAEAEQNPQTRTILEPFVDIVKTIALSKLQNTSNTGGGKTTPQHTKIRQAFDIVDESRHADKFIRVLSERQTPIATSISEADISGLLRIVIPELGSSKNAKLARILAIAIVEE